MKKSNLIVKSLMILTVLFMVSCNNDDTINCPDELAGPLSEKESAFAGTWTFTGMMAEDALDFTDDKIDNPSKDIFAQNSECDRDLVYNLMADRKYSLKRGSTATDCNNMDSLTGTWALSADSALSFVANCSTQTTPISINEQGNSFSYTAQVTFRDVNGIEKRTKVTYTYSKSAIENTPE